MEKRGQNSSKPDMFFTPVSLLFFLIVSIFTVEAVSMFIISLMPPLSTLPEALLDSAILTVLVSPLIYLFVFRPLVRQYTDRKQAEEQTAIFRQFTDASGQGLAMATPDAKITYANPSLLRLMGENKLEDVIGKTFVPYYPEELQQRLQNEIIPAVMERGQWVGELAIKSTDGSLTPTQENFFLIRDENGNPLCLADIMTDITERKQAEDALLESEAKFKTLVTNTEEIIFMTDKNGKFLLSEGKGLSKLGLKPGQVVGESVFELYKDYPDMLNAMRKALNGETVAMEVDVGDNCFRSWYTPQKSREGEIIGLLGLSVNITERKRAEEQTTIFREFAEASGQGFGMATVDGKVTYVNHSLCVILGEENPENIIGKPIASFYPEELQQRFQNEIMPAVMKRGQWTGESTLKSADGKLTPTLENIFLIHDDKGNPLSIACIMTDITKLKRAEEQAAIFRQFVDASGQGVGMGTLDGKITYANPAVCRLLGEDKPEDVIGKALVHYYPEEMQQRIQNEIIPAVMERGQWVGELALKSTDGKLTPTLENFFLIRDEKGNPICLADIMTDISLPKRTEETLRRRSYDLGERVKELNCLYSISGLIEVKDISPDKIMQGTVDLIPPAWQYPDITCARIVMDGSEFKTENFVESEWKQACEIVASNENVGTIEVYYGKQMPEFDEGPFLKEERHLIKILAEQLGSTIERVRAEEAISASEHKYKTLLENIPQKIFSKDKDSVYVSCNENYARDLKIKPEEIAGKTDDDFFPKEMAEKYRADDRKTMEHGETEELDERYIEDDKEFTVHTIKTPIRDENGDITGILGVFWDITEQKRAEEALKKSQQKYKALVNSVPCMIYRANPDWSVSLVGTWIERITGYSISAFEDGTINWTDIIHSDDMATVLKESDILTKEPRSLCQEYRIIRKDGSIAWVRDSKVSLHDERGFMGIDGAVLDITESKQAEQALRESEETYRGLVENIDVGISMIGPHMEILSLNRKMKEWFPNIDPSKKAICDESYNDSPDNGIFSYSLAARTLKDGEVHEEITESPAGDNVKSFRAVSFPINDNQGNIVAAIEMVEDITEKLKIEEAHARTDKLESIGTLAGGLAHDFNNLLAGFMGNISMAKMDIDPETDAYIALERAESASVRAKRLTLQLLTFAKGGAPAKELTSIPELVEDTVGFALSGSNIKCDFQMPDDTWEITVDKAQIGQAIRNLVQNAAQAMTDGGNIMISVENLHNEQGGPLPLDEGKYVKISVKDQGVGIAEENLQKIFEPYFTTKEMGSGLGLPAVYSIVKNHAGHIDVDSEVGVGTTFSVCLPATEKEVSPEPAAEEKIISGNGRVLVMDDEEMIRLMLEDMLEIIGYEVECTADGAEAIEVFKKEKDSDRPFDVLIIDLTIPGGMGGKEAMAKIREIDSEVKSIVSSGYSSDKVVANFKEYGFTGCLNKPYNTSQLSSVLDEVLTS